jgi:hypothetical protein
MTLSRSTAVRLIPALGLILLTLGAGCGVDYTTSTHPQTNTPQSGSSTLSQPSTKTYTNVEKKFTLEYPDSWTLREKLPNTDAQILAPAIDDFSPNIGIKMSKTDIKDPHWSSPEKLSEYLVEGSKDKIKDFNLVSSETIKLDGHTTLKLTFTSSDPEAGSNLKAQSVQYWTLLQSGNYYLIEIIRPLDKPTVYEAEFDAILKSFKITE